MLAKHEEEQHYSEQYKDDVRLNSSCLKFPKQNSKKTGKVSGTVHHSINNMFIETTCTRPKKEERQKARAQTSKRREDDRAERVLGRQDPIEQQHSDCDRAG